MTASLRVKNDKYYVVLTHTTDGKKNQTWVSTGLTVTGNEGKARQLMLDMLGEKPEQAAPPDMLFSDAVRRWLEDVRHRVDEVTYQGYEGKSTAERGSGRIMHGVLRPEKAASRLGRIFSPTLMTCKSGCAMLTARRCRPTST